MTTTAENQTTSQNIVVEDIATPERTSSGAFGLDLAVFGGLIAGSIAIIQACQMERAADCMVCLLGSFAACGLVCYLYFRGN